jgi:hypothetical protein
MADLYKDWDKWAHKILNKHISIKADRNFVHIKLNIIATHKYPKNARVKPMKCAHRLEIKIPLKDIYIVAKGYQAPCIQLSANKLHMWQRIK